MNRTYRFNPIKLSVIQSEDLLIQLMDDVLGAYLGVKAGMQRAKAQGKRISRPKLSKIKLQELLDLHKIGLSINRISKKAKVAYGTVYNYLKK
jgi:hypothetical protein